MIGDFGSISSLPLPDRITATVEKSLPPSLSKNTSLHKVFKGFVPGEQSHDDPHGRRNDAARRTYHRRDRRDSGASPRHKTSYVMHP